MVEEDKNKSQTEEAAKEEVKKELSIVEEAAKIRDEIKSENDRRENILKEEQKLQAEKMLSGTGGGNVPAKKKESTPQEYAEAAMKGEILNE